MKDLLPGYELLSKKQDEAIRFPGNRSMLVTGPPGSGKTVIALYRASELLRNQKKVDIIVYGNVLFSYLNKSLEELDIKLDVNTTTFHRWIRRHIRNRLRCQIPTLGNPFAYDWRKLTELYAENGIPQEFDNLIVDEGQDLPINFYLFATRMANSITVFADENQAIFESTNSSIRRIRNSLRRFSPKEICLEKNHRNTKAIARIASLFMVKGIETGKTEEPQREGELPLICYSETVQKQIDFVVNYASNHKNQQIGIFLATKKSVIDWYNKLKKKTKVLVQYYVSGADREGNYTKPPKFDQDGIFVVTHHSAKGLEFDTVFAPQLNFFRYDYSTDDMMRLYVVCSRPRDRLVLMYTGKIEPEILKNTITKCETSGQDIVKRYNLDDLISNNQEQLFTNDKRFNNAIRGNHRILSESLNISEFLDNIDENLLTTGTIQQFTYERIIGIVESEYQCDEQVDKKIFRKFINNHFSNRLAQLIIKFI